MPKEKTIKELSKESGIKEATIKYRLKHGWNVEQAIETKPKTTDEIGKDKQKYDVLGNIFKNNLGYSFIVEAVDHIDSYHVKQYRIRFLDSGYTTTATAPQIISNPPKNRLSPSVFNVGILGYAHRSDDVKMFDAWRAIIARCYNEKNPSYKTYGAKGVTICERWKRFDYFLEDIKNLPGYNKEMIDAGKLVLDKDIIDRSKLIYSPDSCCFVSRSENTKESATRTWNDGTRKRCND